MNYQLKQVTSNFLIRFKNREAIEKYVDNIYNKLKDDESLFINNKPSFIFNIIHKGIEHFNEFTKK